LGTTTKQKIIFMLCEHGQNDIKCRLCDSIEEMYGYFCISATEQLQNKLFTGRSQFSDLEKHIKNKNYYPAEITSRLIEEFITYLQRVKAMDKFLIYDFPKSKDHVEGWERIMGSKVNLQFIFFLDCADEICVDRSRPCRAKRFLTALASTSIVSVAFTGAEKGQYKTFKEKQTRNLNNYRKKI
jgi:adenylate kinase family enzyme